MDKRGGLRCHIEVVDYAARSEVGSLDLMKKELQQLLHVTLFFSLIITKPSKLMIS